MVTRKGKKPELSSEELKGRITDVARKHFAMHGMNGTSVKDIAAEANVAGSLINYHFTDKAGLFKACVEPFARTRMEAIMRILNEPKSREEMKVRIELFVEEMQNSVLNERDVYEILDREMRAANPVVLNIFQDTLLLAFKAVVAFFEKAKQNGLLYEDADPMHCSSMLFTTTCDTARKDVLGKRFFNVSFEQPEYRRRFAEQVASLFCRGVIK